MGIYPEHRKGPVTDYGVHGSSWVEYRETPGLVEERDVKASGWTVKERTDCFCCSCDEGTYSSDAACRNHGFAAKRPCETHQMPGQPWDHELAGFPSAGKMPSSVQAVRKLRAGE